jgi:ubiquinone/menaquinone biosynthesis C-methylase UbiE
MTNEDERERWNGVSGEAWVRRQEQYDRMLAPWGALLAETAAVAPGERVLDVGCGCGATTLAAAERAAGVPAGGGDATGGVDATGGAAPGVALGVDLSEPMIAVARRRAAEAGLDHVAFRVADAQTDDLGVDDRDVVVSRFGVMFFDDPVAAFANVARATRPGGRLACVVWGPPDAQEWLLVPMAAATAHLPPPGPGLLDGPGMFALARPEHTTDVLERAGWRDVALVRHERAVRVGGGTVDDAVSFLAGTGPGRALLDGVEEATVDKALDAIRQALADHLTPDGVVLRGTAWALTARR